MTFRSRITSVVWEYFTKDNVSKKALCSLCNELYCYRSTTANLKGHLQRKHPDAYKQFELRQAIRQLKNEKSVATADNDDDDSNSSVEIPAEVWNFFERDAESDPGRARCVVCNATVSLLDMVEHMKEEHPKVNTKTEFLTEEFEVEEDTMNNSKEKDAFDTEIVYVQENQGYKKQPPPKRRQSRNFNVDRKRLSKYLHEEEDADDVASKLKRVKYQEKDHEEIDKFTTYVTCLLKQLPKDVCAKLQMDIINLIMTAKLKMSQQSATETQKPTAGGMITVTSVDGTYMLVPPSVEKSVTVPTSDAAGGHSENGRTDPTADS